MTSTNKTMISAIIKYWQSLPDIATLASYVMAGWVLAPVAKFVEKFIWSDWEFVAFLSVMMMLDSLVSAIVAFRKRQLDSTFITEVILKAFAYAVILITFHILGNHTVNGNPNSIMAVVIPYVDAVIYSAILIREAVSINESLTHLGFNLIPKFVMKKIRQFQADGVKIDGNEKA